MNPKIKRATLADVAKLAGVSLGSASRALSDPHEVKPATLEKVTQAVAQLDYVRNGAAQALASKRTRMIAVIYPSLDNPIFASSVNSLQMTLWSKGYQLLIASHEYDWDREAQTALKMIERGIDGLILVGTDHQQSVFDTLRKRQIPYVLTWSKGASEYPHCIGFSNEEAAYNMAKLVIAKGHKDIAICAGTYLHNERAKARVQGTLRALKEAGIEIDPNHIIEEQLSVEGGRQGLTRILEFKKRPTVIIFGNDAQAIGAIAKSRELGIKIPEEISVTGFDDIELASLVDPPLTTNKVPINEIGIRAAEMIVELINGEIEQSTNEADNVLPTQVIERKSLRDIC